MSLVQEIILYFEIIPILMFLVYAVIKSYIEDKKIAKKKNMALIRRNKMLAKRLNKIEYNKLNKIQFQNCVIK